MISRNPTNKGFTLVEILTVIAIMAILAGLSVPAISSLNRSGQANVTFSKLTEIMEQARQYAVAQNTYVWVAFSSNPASGGTGTQLSTAVVASADGTDLPSNWTSGVGAGTGLVQIAKTQTFQLAELKLPGNVTPSTTLPEIGQAINSTAQFSVTLPSHGTPTIFSQAIQFTPSGEARNTDGAPVDLVEFDVQTEKGPGVADPKNGAVFQVNGLTGETRIYRQ